MKTPLLDLVGQYRTLREEIEPVVRCIIEEQRFILGKELVEFEWDIAAFIGSRHAIGVSSGTDAILAGLMAAGIGPGDKVVTTPFSFFATAGSIVRVGATPVLIDIEADSFCMDMLQLEDILTRDTVAAVIPVHLYGQVCDMERLLDLKRRFGFVIIEDACQAIGAQYRDGRQAGTFGEFGCFSFFPSKNLGGFGDGGLVTAQDDGLAGKIVALRNHGSTVRYYHDMIGGNFRLDNLQAAVLAVKLKHLKDWNAARRRHADTYGRLFAAKGLLGHVTPPVASWKESGVTDYHIYHQYVIRAERRDELKKHLVDNGIGCEVYYPCPFHQQRCFEYLGYRTGDFPVTEAAAAEVLALPIYPELTEGQIEGVVDEIAAFYGAR